MRGRKERRRQPPATSSDFETLKLESFFKCSPRHKHVVGGLKMHHVNFGPRIYFVPTSPTYVNYRRQTLTAMTSIRLILTFLKVVMTFIFVNQGQNSCEVKIRKKSPFSWNNILFASMNPKCIKKNSRNFDFIHTYLHHS